ncbi:HAD-IA family hydrolase [Arthrobacter sp. H14-L1]|uniref:HAD-IA family hydrolase n=1 Tax=Arthrobacter sp. H14-L1 TaxID=2996697 RepID=UPI00226D483E|nr:HAD-IA family hydrolase [Arthrobacter sp. H14-L1]MCY0905907.1 HAD-IA family hydrolase [Arthrobacter sp. H14-L1]
MPALIFDCDGVLADTEQHGHLPAFNQTFADFNVPVRWSVAEYAQKVKIGGGKERMRSILTPDLARSLNLKDDAAIDGTLLAWHQRKTAVYKKLVESGVLPARPGIARIVREAHDAGWTLAVASTSAEPAVRAVLTHAVGESLAQHFAVFAGDIVPQKKPAPDIYLFALKELDLDPDETIVVEDSANGLRAALGAGLRALVTVSGFTREEDFTGASLVVGSLGDAGQRAEVLANPAGVEIPGTVNLATLEAILAQPRNDAGFRAAAGSPTAPTNPTETP